MSRMGGGDVRTIAPTNNVYTALCAAAFIVQAIGFIVLFMRAKDVGGLF